ncbi:MULTISPECIES: hypothetical protein [Actinomycetes]|uniref:Uncharacterized protein n=1 Tax=Streptomyces noursei TaxID=1971 RepID=A0A2N8P430_STRNR|nr:hypothetical protein [Streptomyces noursei]PNE35785.1 hypothetical protein AOB60_43145 [Streptomyces noursei]
MKTALFLSYLSGWRIAPRLVASWWRCWPESLRLLSVLLPVEWGMWQALASAGVSTLLCVLAAAGAGGVAGLVVQDLDDARWARFASETEAKR